MRLKYLLKRALKGIKDKALIKRPHIQRRLEPIWEAFWELNNSRLITDVFNHISASEIQAYIEINKLSKNAGLVLFRLVTKLDSFYVNEMNESIRKEIERRNRCQR